MTTAVLAEPVIVAATGPVGPTAGCGASKTYVRGSFNPEVLAIVARKVNPPGGAVTVVPGPETTTV
jgi:hypothetical protein